MGLTCGSVSRTVGRMSTIANRINAAAREILPQGHDRARGTSMAGQGKVFIDLVLAVASVTREQLLAEHAAGRVELARCDLVQAFDRLAVAAAETKHPAGAVFHFVVLS